MWIAATSSPVTDSLLWVVLYIGPDLMMPITSALAAAAGVVLMFWNRFVGAVRTARQMLFERNRAPREQ